MISMMDAISAEHQQAQGTKAPGLQPLDKKKSIRRIISNNTTASPAPSFHKRLWSLQSLAGGGQQWRKVGPLPPSSGSGKDKEIDITTPSEKSPEMVKQLPSLSFEPILSEDRSTTNQVSGVSEFGNRDSDHADTDDENDAMDEDSDLEHKHGLRRKAAKGLKRIMTHFSLSDVNSLSDIPHLSEHPLPDHNSHHQSPTMLDQEKKRQVENDSPNTYLKDKHQYNLSKFSQQYSSDSLPVVPVMQSISTPLENSSEEKTTAMRSKIIELLPTSSHNYGYQRQLYRSQSNPTAPLLRTHLASLADRSLPPLPSSPGESKPSRYKYHAMDEYIHLKNRMNEAQVEQKFRQAVSWLGKPFHRFLSSPLLSTMANGQDIHTPSSPLMIQTIHHLRNSPVINNPSTLSSIVSSSSGSSVSYAANATTAAKLLSRRDSNSLYDQQRHTYQNLYGSIAIQEDPDQLSWVRETSLANGKILDLNFRFARKKVLRCRVVQITNIASSKEYQYELFVQLNDTSQASQIGTMKKIAKGISAASPKESFSFEVDSPFTLSFTLCAKPVNSGFSKMKTLISKMDLSHHHHQDQETGGEAVTTPTDHPSDHSPQFISTMPVVGSTCLLSGNKFEAFSGKGLSRYMLTKPSSDKNQKEQPDMDLELTVAFQLEDAVSPSHTYMSGLWTGELDFEAALASCHQGDYLTFYVRSKQFPTWTRYWITLEQGHLYFRHLSYEHKEPIDSIPLGELESVCKPWEDIQEQVYFGRKHGIVLKFKKEHIHMDKVALEQGEELEGYMYLFADSPKKAALWRTVLSAYATADYVTPNASLNVRYLW